jgi:hypothetical protein
MHVHYFVEFVFVIATFQTLTGKLLNHQNQDCEGTRTQKGAK